MEPPTSSWAQGVADWPLIPAPSPCAGVDATRGRATRPPTPKPPPPPSLPRPSTPHCLLGGRRRDHRHLRTSPPSCGPCVVRELSCGLRSLQGARSRQIYIYTISSVLRLSATLVCVIDCLQKGLVHSYVINDKPHVSHTGAPKAKRAQAIEYVI